MSTAHRAFLVGGITALGACALPIGASAAAPVWKLTVASVPTNFARGSAPGEEGSFGNFSE